MGWIGVGVLIFIGLLIAPLILSFALLAIPAIIGGIFGIVLAIGFGVKGGTAILFLLGGAVLPYFFIFRE